MPTSQNDVLLLIIHSFMGFTSHFRFQMLEVLFTSILVAEMERRFMSLFSFLTFLPAHFFDSVFIFFLTHDLKLVFMSTA